MTIKSFYDTLAVPLNLAREHRNRKHIHLRRAGDRARDTKNWPEAIRFYERYLALLPTEGSTWVQLGHVRKENGQLDDAETAYLTAQKLMPRNADLLLQLGHLFKLQGRRDDAVESYAASLKLAPGASAYAELIGLDEIALANSAISASKIRLPPAVYLQISDLLSYLEHHKTVSGIQRVQLAIIEHVINLQEETGTTNYQFVCGGSRGTQLFLVEIQTLKAIASYLSGIRVDHGHLGGLVMKARSTTTLVALGKGDTLLVLGSFWGQGGSTESLRSLKTIGVKTGIYFYDIIPFTHPEFCDDLLTAEFTQALIEATHFIDFGLAISDFTRDEVTRFLRKNGITPFPLHTVALAHSFASYPIKLRLENERWPENIVEFQGNRFVLCVSTIEIRKNHRYLFEIWKALIDEGVDVPLLLFIGRQGWRIDDLMGQLKATSYLNARIKILHDISDGELSYLYRHCLFTTFPSLVEGWGLPIGESLSFGKLCVASNTSAMPEVGGALVEYVDPLNTRAAIDTFRSLIENPGEITNWEARIRATFQQRDWPAVSRHFLEMLSHISAELRDAPGSIFVPVLESGVVFDARLERRTPNEEPLGFKRRQLNLIFREYWGRPTEHGVPIAGSEGMIIFKPDTGNRRVIVLLRFRIGENLADCKIVASSNECALLEIPIHGGSEPAIRLSAQPDDDGCIRIRLRVDKHNGSKIGDAEQKAIFIRSLGYADSDDRSQWARLLEGILQINAGARVC